MIELSSDFFDEKFYLALSFFIFLYLAYKPIRKAILKSLDTKIDTIKNQLLEAQKLKEEADSLLKQTQQEIFKLDLLKAKMTQEAKTNSEDILRMQKVEVDNTINRRQQEALALLQHKQDAAASELQTEFVQKVTSAVENYFKELNDDVLSDYEIAQRLRGKN